MRTDDVIAYFGSAAKTAEFLNISRSAVSQWPEFVPEGSARKLEKLTNAKLAVDEAVYSAKSAA